MTDLRRLARLSATPFRSSASARTAGDLAFISVLLSLALWMGWVGFLASDGSAYLAGGIGWLNHFPYVGTSHWEIRTPLTLAIAASIGALGESEFHVILPTLIYGVMLILLVYVALAKTFDRGTAVTAVAIFALTPLTAESLSVPDVDAVEAFFVVASFASFLVAVTRRGSTGWLIFAGMLAAAAFLSRATSSALIGYYGILFLFRPMLPRSRYFVMGAGFLLVFGADALYYTVMAHDPLYRFHIALRNYETIDQLQGGTGNVTSNPWLGPIASLFVNNEVGLLFWFAGIAAFVLFRRAQGLTPNERTVVWNVGGLGLTWFLILGYATHLRALPRYFIITTVAGAILAGIWIWRCVAPRRPVLAGALLAVYGVSSLALIDLANQELMLPERTVTRVLAAGTAPHVFTDPRTAWRAEKFLEWAKVSPDAVTPTPPSPGGIYVYVPSSVDRGQAGPHGAFDPSKFRPAPDWKVVSVVRGDMTLTGRVIRALGLTDTVMNAGLGRLIWQAAPVTIYERPPATG